MERQRLKRLIRRHLDEPNGIADSSASISLKRLIRRHLDERIKFTGKYNTFSLKRLIRRHLDELMWAKEKAELVVLSAGFGGVWMNGDYTDACVISCLKRLIRRRLDEHARYGVYRIL